MSRQHTGSHQRTSRASSSRHTSVGGRKQARSESSSNSRSQNRIDVPAHSIAVIGGGASGLMAAVFASGALRIDGDIVSIGDAKTHRPVDVYEAQTRTGKPVLVTGAGRCNITNAHVSSDAYRNPGFVDKAFATCTPKMVRAAFSSLGLEIYEEDEGRCYPVTNRASTVVDVLRAAIDRAGVSEHCSRRIEGIRRTSRGLFVRMPDGQAGPYDAVIIATGGKPAHDVIPEGVPSTAMRPTLAPLRVRGVNLRPVDRMRARCVLSCNGHVEAGEAMFRPDGVSGIAAFNVSRFARPGDELVMNLAPWASSPAFFSKRAKRIHPTTWEDMCRGIFLPRVGQMILSYCGIAPHDAFDPSRVHDFERAATGMKLVVEGIADPSRAQVHRGGVQVSSIDATTMQVKEHPYVYIVGEGIDVDGPCGGYNLHWAWTSGMIAGAHAYEHAHKTASTGHTSNVEGGRS